MITIQKLMKAEIQRRKVPDLDLDLDLKVFKMKICGILEKLKIISQDIILLRILNKPACVVIICLKI